MNLIRLLLVIFLIWVAYRAIRRLLRPRQGAPRVRQDERMVRCAACGLHVPESTALGDGEQRYCSAVCRDRK